MSIDLIPVEMVCMRCGHTVHERFAGPCSACRDELAQRYAGRAHNVETAEYEPKMNVTPNAVALKDD